VVRTELLEKSHNIKSVPSRRADLDLDHVAEERVSGERGRGGDLERNQTCARRRWVAYLTAVLHRFHDFCPKRAVFVSPCVYEREREREREREGERERERERKKKRERERERGEEFQAPNDTPLFTLSRP
jgi:hypothetical protein